MAGKKRKTNKAGLVVVQKPECIIAVKEAKKLGFKSEIFEKLVLHGHVMFVVYYVTNGFNASEAALSAGYSKKNAEVLMHNPRVTDAIRKAIDDTGVIEFKIKHGLLKLDDFNVADYEEFLDGTKTIKQLKKEGVNTALLKSATKGIDKNGKPYGKIEGPDRRAVLESLSRVAKATKASINIDVNNSRQINVFSNIPSYRDRNDEETIDVEAEEKQKDEDSLDVAFFQSDEKTEEKETDEENI